MSAFTDEELVELAAALAPHLLEALTPEQVPQTDEELAELAVALAPHLVPHVVQAFTPAQVPRAHVDVREVDGRFVYEHTDPQAQAAVVAAGGDPPGPTVSKKFKTGDAAAAAAAEALPGVPLYRTDARVGPPTDPRPGVTHLVASGPGRFRWMETHAGETVALSATTESYGQALDEARLHAEFHEQELVDEVAKDGLV